MSNLLKKIPLLGKKLDPAQLRAKQIAEEQKKRYEEIAQKILDVVIQEKVTVVELPVIISILTRKVNVKIDKAEVEKILNLDKNDK